MARWASSTVSIKTGGPGSGVSYMRLMIRAIKCLSIPATKIVLQSHSNSTVIWGSRWEVKVGPDSTAHLLGETFGVYFGVSARGEIIAPKIRPSVASEAALALHRWVCCSSSTQRIANQHAETLDIFRLVI